MTDTSETPKILDEITKAGANPSHRPAIKRNARRRLLITSLSLICIVITISYLSFQLRALQQEFVLVGKRYENLIVSMAEQNSRVQDLAAELDQYLDTNIEPTVIEDFTRLTTQVEELRTLQLNQMVVPDLSWKIQEAAFLLNMANRKLFVETDIQTSIALIENADAALVESRHNNVILLRSALSKSLSDLRNAVQFDKEGVFIKIDSLKTMIEELEPIGMQNMDYDNKRNSIRTDETPYNREGLDSFFNLLSSIFVWQEWSDNSETILTISERNLAMQSMYSLLEQARYGLISENEVIYQQSLKDCKEWASKYSSRNSFLRQSINAELDELIAVEFNPEVPSLDEPLRLISQLIYEINSSQ